MELSLIDKRALVCGSSQGIGRSIALQFAQCGASVTVLARNQAALKQVQQEMESLWANSSSQATSSGAGPLHDYIVADFSHPEEVKDKVNAYLSDNPPFDILVNNTGGPPPGPVHKATADDLLRAFSSHLLCNHHIAQALIEGMKRRGGGRIINIVSTSVKQPLAGLGVSNTVRGAVASWAKTLANELGEFGITVNNILPGATETERLNSIIARKSEVSGKTMDQVRQDMLSEIPLNRFARPEEIANAAAFLASSLAEYITGTSILVDGGRTSSL